MQSDMHKFLSSILIFRDFTSEELSEIQSIVKEQSFDSNVDIVKEGEISDDFFIVLSGQVEVIKVEETESGEKQFKLITLSTGDVFGEIAFVDHLPRSSTVRTLEPTTVLRITKENLAKLQHAQDIKQKLISNIAKTCIKRLRDSNTQYVNSLQALLNISRNKHHFGIFYIVIFCSFSILSIVEYLFVLLGYNFRSDTATAVNVFLVSLPACYMIWKFKTPLKEFGVTIDKWQSNILEGVIIGIVLSIAAIAFEAIFSGTSFREEFYEMIKDFKGGIWLIVYALLSYIQEFVARGVVQSSAQRFLNDRLGFYAVFVTSVVFAGLHIFRGWQFVSLTFFASFLMGVIFLHRHNLISVSVIHTFLGLVYIPISEKY